MNLSVISLIILLISCNVHVISSFFLRYRVAQKNYQNSFFNSEIIIEGTTAEQIYVMERADQLTQLDNAMKKRDKLTEQKNAAKKFSIFDLNPTKAGLKAANVGRLKYQIYAINGKIEKLEQEMGVNKFCSMQDICKRAFKNSFFTKTNNWILDDEDSMKTKCVEKNIVVKKGEKSFADIRKYVKCKTKEQGPVVFLEASIRYVPGKNLKYFALLDHDNDGYVKPVAYLMNTKDLDWVEVPIEDAEKPLLEKKAS